MSSLWVGTSAGTMMALDVIPYYSERETKPVMLAHSGIPPPYLHVAVVRGQ